MKPIQNRVSQMVVSACAALALCLCGSGPALAQYYAGYEAVEGYSGSPAGVPLTGQLNWYLPPVAGSTNQFVFTYTGNALGLPPNPIGEEQFIGGQGLGGTSFPRAQANFDWSAAPLWVIAYDVAVRYNGALPATDNVSSFSLQDSTTARSFIALNRWENAATAANWRADYNVFNAAGQPMDFQSPGPEWRNLQLDTWYRQYVLIDFQSNRILLLLIINWSTLEFGIALPENWYMRGGASPVEPLPTGLRFFVGGANPGNVTGWDNLGIDGYGAFPPGRPARNRVPRPTEFPPPLVADQ